MRSYNYIKASLAILLLAVAFIAGCGGGGGGASSPDSGRPAVSAPTYVLPTTWTGQGGSVLINADVTNTSSVQRVYATVISPAGIQSTVDMTLASGTNTYIGTLVVPQNASTVTQTYIFTVTVVSNSGVSVTSTSANITIAPSADPIVGPPAPPPPPTS